MNAPILAKRQRNSMSESHRLFDYFQCHLAITVVYRF